MDLLQVYENNRFCSLIRKEYLRHGSLPDLWR